MAEVRLEAVKKSFGDTNIIHGVDLAIDDGEFIVVVGPSGCGKSTLLRMVAGLESLSEGEIIIDDHIVNNVRPKDRDIAMVFQNYALYPHMTVYDNLAYGLKIRHKPKAEIKQRVAHAAEILDLEKYLDRKPKQLSGGQRQRVAMGRAIVREPAIFLFDEPLSNLDQKLRVQMRLQIKKLQKSLKTTSIYVTHDQVEAMTLADRVVVMNAGRVEQIDSPLTIYERPQTSFVAGFIGSPAMNFLKASVSADAQAVVLGGGAVLPLTYQLPANYANKPIKLGIRPEHIIESSVRGVDRFDLTVDWVEELGSDTLIYGNIKGDEQTIAARLPGNWTAKSGDVVTLGVMPDRLHLFDLETGMRVEHD